MGNYPKFGEEGWVPTRHRSTEFRETFAKIEECMPPPLPPPLPNISSPPKPVDHKPTPIKKTPNLVECGDCGHLISKTAQICPNCGKKPPPQRVSLKANVMTAAKVTAFIMGATLLLTLFTTQSGTVTYERHPRPSEIKNLLKDPDSYDAIGWSKVETLPSGYYSVTHQFRAKNSFGGYNIETYEFTYTADGTIIDSKKVGN